MPRLAYLRSRVRLGCIVPALLLSALCASAASAPPAGFQQGNALYAAGKFAEAAPAYESVVDAGWYSANLFYDLGNTYARLGQRGKSILSYQRALLLDPGHAAARANLTYEEGTAKGLTTAGNSWVGTRLGLSDVDLWTLLAATGGWLGAICLLLLRGSCRYRLVAAASGFALCACACAAIWWFGDGAKDAARAIVLADPARALDAPADNSKVIAHLPAGSEVRVLAEQGAWIYARLPDDSPAWFAAADVEKVIPPSAGEGYGSIK